jgi:hypothetical protein
MAIQKKSLIGAAASKPKAVEGTKSEVNPEQSAKPGIARKLTVAKLATVKLATAKLVTLKRIH